MRSFLVTLLSFLVTLAVEAHPASVFSDTPPVMLSEHIGVEKKVMNSDGTITYTRPRVRIYVNGDFLPIGAWTLTGIEGLSGFCYLIGQYPALAPGEYIRNGGFGTFGGSLRNAVKAETALLNIHGRVQGERRTYWYLDSVTCKP